MHGAPARLVVAQGLWAGRLVRMLFTPAITHLLGRSAWWLLKWHDRIIPKVEVGGVSVERKRPAEVAGGSAQMGSVER